MGIDPVSLATIGLQILVEFNSTQFHCPRDEASSDLAILISSRLKPRFAPSG